MTRKIGLLLGLFMLSKSVLAMSSPDYTVTYKNQQGSTLILTWHPEKNTNMGTVSGLLTSSNGICRQSTSAPAAVSGVFTGNAVAMTLSYPKCDKVVAITGNLRNSNTELHTLWLVSTHSRGAFRDADTNQVGSEIYSKVAS